MKVLLCEDTDWLLSEEAFLIYAPCMFHPTYEEYKTKMEEQNIKSAFDNFNLIPNNNMFENCNKSLRYCINKSNTLENINNQLKPLIQLHIYKLQYHNL